MILKSITSWLGSQGYHRPSRSSPGPLLMSSRSRRPPSLIDGASICIKKNPQCIPIEISSMACTTPCYPSSRCGQVKATHKKQCFQSSFLQCSKEGFMQFLSSFRQSAVDAHWDAFVSDSHLILTSLLFLPKQIWPCKFKLLHSTPLQKFNLVWSTSLFSILWASTSKRVCIHPL